MWYLVSVWIAFKRLKRFWCFLGMPRKATCRFVWRFNVASMSLCRRYDIAVNWCCPGTDAALMSFWNMTSFVELSLHASIPWMRSTFTFDDVVMLLWDRFVVGLMSLLMSLCWCRACNSWELMVASSWLGSRRDNLSICLCFCLFACVRVCLTPCLHACRSRLSWIVDLIAWPLVARGFVSVLACVVG